MFEAGPLGPEGKGRAMTGQRGSALILDIDETVLIGLERLLEDDGVQTTTTWDAREALALLRARHYDVVLLAEHPPEINCKQFLRQLRAGGVRTPTVVLQSAPLHPFETRYLESLDACAVVSKRNPQQIAQAVRKVVSHSYDRQLTAAA